VERLNFRTFGRRTLNLLRALACRFKYPFNEWVRPYSYGPRNPLYLEKIIEFAPDLIFTSPLPTFNVFYAYKAVKKLHVPLIVIPAYHIHDPCSFRNPLFFRIMRQANLVIAHSEMEKDFLQIEGKINQEHLKTFPPLPLGKEDFTVTKSSLPKKKLKEKFGITEKKVILFLGQHGRHKNIEPVIKAMPFIWNILDDVALVIAGGTTAYTRYLKSTAERLIRNRGKKIYFFDNFPQEEKAALFDMADVFVCLSEFESFGIVFVEAMFHGLPVIASGFGVAGSIVDNFKTGLLVNPYCEIEVAGAIIELLLDDGIREAYGKKGKEKAFSDYHPEKILDRWEKILGFLLGQNNPLDRNMLDF
jgi:glycosyltransferase involved in cell wall biosynthesis